MSHPRDDANRAGLCGRGGTVLRILPAKRGLSICPALHAASRWLSSAKRRPGWICLSGRSRLSRTAARVPISATVTPRRRRPQPGCSPGADHLWRTAGLGVSAVQSLSTATTVFRAARRALCRSERAAASGGLRSATRRSEYATIIDDLDRYPRSGAAQTALRNITDP